MRILARLGTLRAAATVIAGIGALYFVLVVFGNVTDFGTNREFVRHVLAMDTTFKDPDVMWRSITSPVLADLAYLLIIVWEALTALLLIAAFVTGIRRGSAAAARARRLGTLGWIMAILLFGGGFIVIGGEWFQMWQSEDWNGLQAALQNFLIATAGLITTNLPGQRSAAEPAPQELEDQ